jgi:hypothetical protein
MLKFITEIFAAYIATAILVNGNVFYSLREWAKKSTPYLYKGNPPRHLLDCRMCSGFWVSLFITLVMQDVVMFPLVYGASYFLATQER